MWRLMDDQSFEPELQTLGKRGLSMADAVVDVGGSRDATLVISTRELNQFNWKREWYLAGCNQ